jgi:hypothetical protein
MNFVVYEDAALPKGIASYRLNFQNKIPLTEIVITENDPLMEKKAKFLTYLSKHPLCNDKHNENWTKDKLSFRIVNKETAVSNASTLIKTKNKLISILGDMSYPELRDVAFGEGIDATKMKEGDLFVLLASDASPLLVNAEDSLKKLNNPERELSVLTHKAIFYKIVELRDGYYYLNEKMLGNTIASVKAYLNDNEEIRKSYVVKEVLQRDKANVSPTEIVRDNKASENIGTRTTEANESKKIKEAELWKYIVEEGVPFSGDKTLVAMQSAIDIHVAKQNAAKGVKASEEEKAARNKRIEEIKAELKAKGVSVPKFASLETWEKIYADVVANVA